MRAAALALVLALVSPAVLGALCELSCLQAAHHAAATPAAADCHGHGAQTDGPAVAAGATLCHDARGEAPAATTALGAQTVPGPAIVPTSVAVTPPPATPHAVRPTHTRQRSDPRLTITPLRI
jgi:hypothetical protein